MLLKKSNYFLVVELTDNLKLLPLSYKLKFSIPTDNLNLIIFEFR